MWVYGYKLHLVVDANYGIPLAQQVTTGKRHESPELPKLVERAKRTHPWLAPEVAMADRGYDSAANHQFLWFKRRIIPVIHLCKPSNADLYQGIYTKGGPTCLGMVPEVGLAENGVQRHTDIAVGRVVAMPVDATRRFQRPPHFPQTHSQKAQKGRGVVILGAASAITW